mgnify:CR=1 FL=1
MSIQQTNSQFHVKKKKSIIIVPTRVMMCYLSQIYFNDNNNNNKNQRYHQCGKIINQKINKFSSAFTPYSILKSTFGFDDKRNQKAKKKFVALDFT